MGVFRKNESWWIDYRFRGKRFRQRVGLRKKDADEALAQVKIRIAAGDFVPKDEVRIQKVSPGTISFRDFYQIHFLPWSEMQHSSNHFTRIESIIRVHLAPYFQGQCLYDITPKNIEDYKAIRTRAHFRRGRKTALVSHATINREICCLKILLRKAVEWEFLEGSPASSIRTLREHPNPPRLLEQEEVAALLNETPLHLKALVSCVVYAGLRSSELFHLKWDDIDWNKAELNVVSRSDHHTKNYESRHIPINSALLLALKRHPRRLDCEFVFSNSRGLALSDVRGTLNSAAKRAGIKDRIKLHQLRHAFCSHALMQGIDPRTVQKWMGHKTLSTTLGYAHVSPAHEKSAIQTLRYEKRSPMDTGAKVGQ